MTLVHWFFVPSVTCHHFITGRNEVVAKVMFLQVCVCPQGGACLSACWDARPPPWIRQTPPPATRQTPPRPGRYPRGPGRHYPPLDQADTPGTRQTPPDQADPPRTRQTPPGPGRPPGTRKTPPWTRQTSPGTRQTPPGPGRHPPRKQTPAYSLRAAGTHPTGMHSCLVMVPSTLSVQKKQYLNCIVSQ